MTRDFAGVFRVYVSEKAVWGGLSALILLTFLHGLRPMLVCIAPLALGCPHSNFRFLSFAPAQFAAEDAEEAVGAWAEEADAVLGAAADDLVA